MPGDFDISLSDLTPRGYTRYALSVLGRLVRAVLVLGALGTATAIAFGAGRFIGSIVLVGGLGLVGAGTAWLPRAAHRAFRRGDFDRAALYYGVLRWLVFDPAARESVEVSRAAADLARLRTEPGAGRLDRVRSDELSDAATAAWLNNRAYALARGDVDARRALELVDRAIASRPDVPGFRHTRGLALLVLGRVEAAIRELDAVWGAFDGADAAPVLEAERCYDLGCAWEKKSHGDYARDYFERSQRAAPESVWAERATEKLRGTATDHAVRQTGVALPEGI